LNGVVQIRLLLRQNVIKIHLLASKRFPMRANATAIRVSQKNVSLGDCALTGRGSQWKSDAVIGRNAFKRRTAASDQSLRDKRAARTYKEEAHAGATCRNGGPVSADRSKDRGGQIEYFADDDAENSEGPGMLLGQSFGPAKYQITVDFGHKNRRKVKKKAIGEKKSQPFEFRGV
jgi:hypothetical protein